LFWSRLRDLVRELFRGLRTELGAPRLPVIATGDCALRIARQRPEIRSVHLHLTL